MKKIGTRKEVYTGVALKTSGGMTRDDIIKSLNQKAKKIYLSKKISSRMKDNSPLVSYRKNKQSKKKEKNLEKLNVSDIRDMLMRERKLQRIKRRKLKSLKSQNDVKEDTKNKSKKLSFALNKNKTKEYYCSNLNNENFSSYMNDMNDMNGYERDDEDDNYQSIRREFKIEEPPDIKLEDLFI